MPQSMRILEQLGDSLSKGKTSERFFAATLLGETNSSIAANLLLHALNDPDENVSKEAEKSLIKIGEKAIDALIEVAIGNDPKLAKKAEAVLIMFGGAACKKIISRLESILFEEDSFYNSNEKTDLLKLQEKRLLEISSKFGEMRKFAFERLFQTSLRREYIQSILESDEGVFEPSQKRAAAEEQRNQKYLIEALSLILETCLGEDLIPYAQDELKLNRDKKYNLFLNTLIKRQPNYSLFYDQP